MVGRESYVVRRFEKAQRKVMKVYAQSEQYHTIVESRDL